MFRSLTLIGACVAALASAGLAAADGDLIRLDGKGDAQVEETRYYGGGWGRGYYGGGGWNRGYYGGGWNRGFYGGGWGRGYYGGGFYGRPWYGAGYRSYWGGGYGVGLGFGVSSYYGGWSVPSYYYSVPTYSYYVSPCASESISGGSTTLTLGRPTTPQVPGDGTFPYDGGPRDGYLATPPAMSPVQIPNRPSLPREGRLVSIPTADPYQFRAFGEQPVEPLPAPVAPETLRVSYPAYGEAMPTFSGGTTVYRTALR